jgi:hypothetical protein
MINKSAITVMLAALAACASAPEQITKLYAPDGREAYALDCSGGGGGWPVCFKKAGEICQSSGYDVISQESEDGQVFAPVGGVIVAVPRNNRTMIVSCRAAKPET